MRALKLCIALGLVLAVSGTAAAVTIPYVPLGPTYLNSSNRDNGTAYIVDEDVATIPVTFDPYGVLPAGITKDPPAGQDPQNPMEDTWGAWTMTLIAKGEAGNNVIDMAEPEVDYYTWGDGDTYLVGMFWGGQDKEVKITAADFSPPSGTAGHVLSEFEVKVDNVQAELWAVDKNLIVGTQEGPKFPKARPAPNRYDDWMEEGWLASGGAVKLLRATSTTFRFTGKLIDMTGDGYTADDQFQGETTAYWDVDPTLTTYFWNPYWGLSDFYTDEEGNPADMMFSWQLGTTTTGWDTQSTDIGGVDVVPEPATMLAVFAGLSGLAGYIRKRRSA
jgi:hypothetical protein